jgi:cystathionine beta-lyase/cystathionine gamma-synthase
MPPTLMSVLLAAKLTLATTATATTASPQTTMVAERTAYKATYEVVDTTKVGFDVTTHNNGCGNNGQCNRNC